jgi:hypothetical protein
MKDQEASTLKITVETHSLVHRQPSTRGHFYVIEECLLQKLLGGWVYETGNENRA